MTGLTKVQWELLGYVASFINEHGYSPTFEQMRVRMGYASKASVHRIIEILQERGYVIREHQRAGTLSMTANGADVAEAFLSRLRSRETVAA